MKNEERRLMSLHTAKLFGKKSLCILLSCLMVITAVPLFSFAEETGVENTAAQENISTEADAEPDQTKVLKSITAVVDGETYTVEPENGEIDPEKIENDILIASENKVAAAPDDVDFSKYDVATIKAIVDFKRNNNNRIAKTFTATDGSRETYYGSSNYNTCKDDNLDLICDTCGYCLDGCTDGTLMTYTEDDVATHGESIRHLVQASYSYDVYDDAGNFVETRTESWEYYEYDSYYADDGDGLCDKCGQPMCSNANASTSNPHSYADGICDNPLCLCCTGTHIDKQPADGKCDICGKCTDDCLDVSGGETCDVCGKCTGTCVDADANGKCDTCGKCMGHVDEKGETINHTEIITNADDTTSITEITEEIGDGKCDICGTRYCLSGHVDSDSDGICDCGLCTGSHVSADGFCDECGYCMADCVAGTQGFCVNCHNKVASFFCDNHSDKLGSDNCIYCDKAYCAHMTAAEIMQEYQWYLGVYSYLISINEDGTAPEGCTQEWLDGLKCFVTAYDEDATGDINGIHSVFNMRKNSGSIRDRKYSSKFNSLNDGQYYYVNADTSDVFYFLIKSVFKLMGDDDSFNAILNMIGLSNDTLKQTVANIKLDNLDLDEAIINDIVTDGKLDLDKIRDNIDQGDLLVVLAELIVPSDKYDVTDMAWKSSVKMTSESADYDTIPYLEYDNEWKESFAATAVNDVDDVANKLITALGIDLEGYTDVASFLKSKLDTTLNGDIITQIVNALSGLGGGMSTDVLALLKKTTGLDLSQWSNDYAYLFDSGTAPASKAFPLLTATADGDGTYTWTYNGAVVTDYNGVFEALGYVISPFAKVLDTVLTGKDLKVLEYTKQAGLTGSVLTVKGTEGYSCAIIPLLEALGVNSDDILTQSEFNSYAGGSTAALTYSLNLLVGRVYEIINSEQPVAQLMQLVIQLLYFLSSNGFGTVLNDIAHPIITLVDIIRPIVSVDVDAILNGIIRNATYVIGGYSSADYMKQVTNSRSAELSLEDISLEAVLKLVGVIVSCKKGDSRVFLDLYTPVSTAMDDIAYYRQAKTSKALDKNGNAKTYYSISLSGADCFTSIISMFLEVAMYADNAYVIDTFAKTDGLVETAIKTVYGLDVTESTDFDWAYILSSSATSEQKQALLNTVKSRGGIAADDYRKEEIEYLESYDKTDWDEETADYLADYLNEIINTVLADAKSQYANLGELLNGLVSGYMTDETVDKIVYAISDILKGESIGKFKELIYWADGVLDLDLSVYEVSSSKTVGSETVYLDADGNETGLKRRTVAAAADMGQAVADILEPLGRILSWLLLGEDLQYFNTSGNVDGKNRRDDLITVTGSNGYATGLLPLLEALGCKNLKAAADYTADGQHNTASLLSDMLNSLVERVLDLVSDGDPDAAVDKIIDLLPNLFYFINSDGLTLAVNNIAASINAVLEVYSEYSGKETTLSSITGFPIDDISFVNLFKIVKDSTGININDYITNLFSTLTIGNIYYNSNSKCDFDTYYMAYSDGEDRAEMLTIVLSVALDLLEDPTNEAKFKELLGENAYTAVINMLNLWQFEFEMQDFSWIFTDIADTGTVVSALTMSELFGESAYGHLWTREKAVELVKNLDAFVTDMLYLLGLSMNGVKLLDFPSLMHALVGENLYNGDIINKLLGGLQTIGPLLDNYDPDLYLSGLIKNILNIDVHAWDKYGENYDWGFENGDRAGFEAALTEVLKPLAPALQWLLCDEEYSFFIDADGVADSNRYNNSEQLVLYGAEGYAYGIVPIFEALNVKNIVKPADYSAQASSNADSAVSNIVSPLLDRVDELMNGTPTDIFELLPSVIYFINSNGLDTCFRDLLHAMYRIFDAIEPITGGIDLYNIIGIDLAEINFEYIFNMLLDYINDATGFRFNTIAANAVNELTQGEVVSFTSLNGRQAYTMKYSGINDYADMLTILMRLVLKFLSVDGNAEVFMHILQSKFEMEPDDYESVYALLQTLLKWAGSSTSIQVALTSIYYIFFGASKASGEGVKTYDLVNDKWEKVVNKLTNSDNEYVSTIISALLEAADETTPGVIDSNGIASNGLIMFFMQIYNFIQQIVAFFKNLSK